MQIYRSFTFLGDKFFRNTAVKNVAIGNGVQIGNVAFYGCEKIKCLLLGTGVKIGQMAFDGCKNLEYVSIQKGTVIDKAAFGSCNAIKMVTLPMDVDIHFTAFLRCLNLKTVVFSGEAVESRKSKLKEWVWYQLVLVCKIWKAAYPVEKSMQFHILCCFYRWRDGGVNHSDLPTEMWKNIFTFVMSEKYIFSKYKRIASKVNRPHDAIMSTRLTGIYDPIKGRSEKWSEHVFEEWFALMAMWPQNSKAVQDFQSSV